MKEIEFDEVKKFVEVMSRKFRSTKVIKIHISYAEWLVAEVERLRGLTGHGQ
ncbi:MULTISPECIES: hypothetical protein [Bacillus amyloliquefaciens group]|uniref:hypothetical protein n=1 Tax=Bacillus amyloliquefaciens group TaxID=1938374 RepID=UPI001C64D615|nr:MULTISPECIES: hypothetical protein [Bacillus amyloliquefaciens group]MBW7976860.1 hypothetical protein [Bacillus velezensis]MCR4368017.1 hypothetical protein [Bacillus amyloliquefaciens]MCV3201378.1 hypothetical protein [Bacillus velezensis]MDW0355772.1 hypothetical protein [Bacillus velezensis]MEE1861688.1 hypothetical protein [Bacillus velezensis]